MGLKILTQLTCIKMRDKNYYRIKMQSHFEWEEFFEKQGDLRMRDYHKNQRLRLLKEYYEYKNKERIRSRT